MNELHHIENKEKEYSKKGILSSHIHTYLVAYCGYEEMKTDLNNKIEDYGKLLITEKLRKEFNLCKKCTRTHNKKIAGE